MDTCNSFLTPAEASQAHGTKSKNSCNVKQRSKSELCQLEIALTYFDKVLNLNAVCHKH